MPDYLHHRRGSDESESFFCRFTFGQFFALLVLEVFTLFFVFYLGARYGRGLLGLDQNPAITMEETANTATTAENTQAPAASGTPEKPTVPTTADPEVVKMADQLIAKAESPELKDRIKKMIAQAQGGGAAVSPVDTTATATPPPQTGPKVITIGNGEPPVNAAPSEPVTQATPASPIAVPPVSEARAPTAPTQGNTEANAAEDVPEVFKKREARTEATAAQDAADRKNATDASVIKIKSAENGRYSLQIGSYPKLDEATRSVERWKSKGYPAFLMIADIPDRGRWYRVRIGGFNSRDDAAKYLGDFSSKEGVEALVVLNEQ